MARNIDITEGIRISWASEILNVYQHVVGEAVEGDPKCIDSIAAHLQRELPTPENRSESIHIRRSLTSFLDRVGQVVHDSFHVRFTITACGVVPRTEPEHIWLDPELSVASLLARWGIGYAEWFNCHHTLPPALRAKHSLQTTFAEPVTLVQLTEAVGCSRTTLIEQFTSAFGMPPAEYLARVRLREGLCRLRRLKETIEEVAANVGYRSGNKFYSRLRRYTDLTPSQIRDMDEKDFERLLEERVSLRPPTPERRLVSTPAAITQAADRRRAERRSAERRSSNAS